MSSKCASKRRNFLVQAQRGFVNGICLVRNRHKQGKPVLPEQRPLRRAYEPASEVEARHPRCVSMAECLSEAPDVVACNRGEPLADAAVNVDALFLGNLASGRATNQVVG